MRQPRDEGAPAGRAPSSDVPVLKLKTPVSTRPPAAATDVGAPGEPFRFADPFAVDVTPATHGRWETTNEGRTAVWRLRVVSVGAVLLNFGFTRYRMPSGGESLRPCADNESHAELWTPPVSASEVVLEVPLPANLKDARELESGWINRGFRQMSSAGIRVRQHGSCRISRPAQASGAVVTRLLREPRRSQSR